MCTSSAGYASRVSDTISVSALYFGGRIGKLRHVGKIADAPYHDAPPSLIVSYCVQTRVACILEARSDSLELTHFTWHLCKEVKRTIAVPSGAGQHAALLPV